MTRTLTRAVTYLQVVIIATFFATVLLVSSGFFQRMVISKPCFFEHAILIPTLFPVISLVFIQIDSFPTIDLWVILFVAWNIFTETIVHGYSFLTSMFMSFSISHCVTCILGFFSPLNPYIPDNHHKNPKQILRTFMIPLYCYQNICWTNSSQILANKNCRRNPLTAR
jgi:hypothetical protein